MNGLVRNLFDLRVVNLVFFAAIFRRLFAVLSFIRHFGAIFFKSTFTGFVLLPFVSSLELQNIHSYEEGRKRVASGLLKFSFK